MSKTELIKLLTQEGEKLLKMGDDFIPWNVYPRPQLKRDSFYCLYYYVTTMIINHRLDFV